MAIMFNVSDADRVQSISEKLLVNWCPIGAVAPELPENISPFISSFEIQAHFTAGQTARALDLIRRSWGWYLNNENGTESTVIEGYLQNATFEYRSDRGYSYDASYISHSHGWSSGPTSALTEYVLGLSVTGISGSMWSLKPHFGDLTHVEGGFTTGLGKFQASWTLKGLSYTVTVSTPEGTVGDVLLPTLNNLSVATVTVDGKVKTLKAGTDGFSINLIGGQHTILVVL
jgi:hypothetical protein